MTLGEFRKFQADDYLMVIALCFYTTLIATINIVRDTSSNLLPPGYDINTLTKEDIKERTYGSKLILVVEQCQVGHSIMHTVMDRIARLTNASAQRYG